MFSTWTKHVCILVWLQYSYLSTYPDFPGPSRDYSQHPGNSRSLWKLQGYKIPPWKLPDSQDFINFSFLLLCTAWVSVQLSFNIYYIILLMSLPLEHHYMSAVDWACHWTIWQRHSYLFRLHCTNLPMHLFCTSIEIFPLRMGLWIFLTHYSLRQPSLFML